MVLICCENWITPRKKVQVNSLMMLAVLWPIDAKDIRQEQLVNEGTYNSGNMFT